MSVLRDKGLLEGREAETLELADTMEDSFQGSKVAPVEVRGKGMCPGVLLSPEVSLIGQRSTIVHG
ncbi:unnamed protein product [Penicillium roqueforti FM164]|uniref:Genomic scaffold, ProqFM164S02 n=1 Tax=Penicillium roqueforti (strain FM164) TaxID=1365484 RepID=W6Q9V4_PENRF|nr:unnamed protein product [Penicillium roqueforti FM164]